MFSDFFEKIDDNEWNEKFSQEAEKYNENDKQHVLTQETFFTVKELKKIVTLQQKIDHGSSNKKDGDNNTPK